MAGIASGRLANERRAWRKNHPSGFFARPHRTAEGTMTLMMWECGIPGKPGTPWEGAIYPIALHFTEDYPTAPPRCAFPKGFYHPNVYPSGNVCLSILDPKKDWKPAVKITQVLLGIQQMLNDENLSSPAQREAYNDCLTQRTVYDRKVREQCRRFAGIENFFGATSAVPKLTKPTVAVDVEIPHPIDLDDDDGGDEDEVDVDRMDDDHPGKEKESPLSTTPTDTSTQVTPQNVVIF